MTRRGNSVVFVLSFAAVPWLMEACGRAANVLEGDGVESPDGAMTATGGTSGAGGTPPGSGGAMTAGRVGTGGFVGAGGSPAPGYEAEGGPGGAGGGPSVDVLDGSSTGTAGTFDWTLTGGVCRVAARDPSSEYVTGDCSAQSAGGQFCACLVNGVYLLDALDPASEEPVLGLFPSCEAAATAFAGGRCADNLKCCFLPVTPGGVCGCADPGRAGMDSCAALVDSLSAIQVEYCPRYRTPS